MPVRIRQDVKGVVVVSERKAAWLHRIMTSGEKVKARIDGLDLSTMGYADLKKWPKEMSEEEWRPADARRAEHQQRVDRLNI
ncbi:MAG: hypothetical protein OXN95_04850 [bacterium]|nr:hypothetical protein [bacterium]